MKDSLIFSAGVAEAVPSGVPAGAAAVVAAGALLLLAVAWHPNRPNTPTTIVMHRTIVSSFLVIPFPPYSLQALHESHLSKIHVLFASS
jgi:hypothetical protein